MTCKEFFDLNCLDHCTHVDVLEGFHPIREEKIFLSIVFSDAEGWAIRTEEDTVLDDSIKNRSVSVEASHWLHANFGEYERATSVEFAALYDDILARLATTGSCVDITYSELSSTISRIEEEKLHEGMNQNLEDWESQSQPDIPMYSVVTHHTDTVLIVSSSDDWHGYLTPILKRENFRVRSAHSLSEGVTQYRQNQNCAILLDGKKLAKDELETIRNLKLQYPHIFLLILVDLPCPYEEELLRLTTNLYFLPIHPQTLIRAFRLFFSNSRH